MDVPTGAKALDDALRQLARAAERRDQDGVETACAAIGLSYSRLLREVAYLNELLDHQSRKEVVH